MVPYSLHAIAHVSDALVQAPVVVNTNVAPTEPLWKWWLTLSAQVLGPLLSTAGSIYVAWRVFNWQGTKDRNAWIRDHQKDEWAEVVSALTKVDIRLPHVFSNMDWSKLTVGLLEDIRNIIPTMRNALFIADELESNGLTSSLTSFASDAAGMIQEIDELNLFLKETSVAPTQEELIALNMVKIGKISKRVEVYTKLHDEYRAVSDKVRIIARITLKVAKQDGQQSPPTADNIPMPTSSTSPV